MRAETTALNCIFYVSQILNTTPFHFINKVRYLSRRCVSMESARTEYWKRFEEISNLIRLKKQLVFYPDLDLGGFF